MIAYGKSRGVGNVNSRYRTGLIDARNATPLHYSWIVLTVCFFNLFFGFAAFASYSIILPEMIRALGFTRGNGADILNAYYFAYVCLSPVTGYLTDRFGARRVISLFWIVLGVGAFLMGTAGNVFQAALFFCLVGIGNAASWAPSVTLVQRWFARGKKGLALGILGAGIGLTFIVMGKVAPAVISHWSWRYCFYFLGAAVLAMACMNALFMRDRPEDKGLEPWGASGTGPATDSKAGATAHAPSKTVGFSPPGFNDFAATSRFWLIGFSYTLIAGALLSVTTFMVDYARNELGFALANASFLASVHGAGQIVGVVVILALSDFIGRRTLIVISNIFIAVCIAGIVLIGANEAILLAGVGLFGAFYGAAFPMYGACGGDYFRKEVMGTVIGLFTLFYGVGAIATSRLAGYLRDLTGSFILPFSIVAGFALLSATIMAFVRKRPD
jgi:sugar phosphate permease